MAVCDAPSVQKEDFCSFRIALHDETPGDHYFARPSAAHAWEFFPRMSRAEALLKEGSGE